MRAYGCLLFRKFQPKLLGSGRFAHGHVPAVRPPDAIPGVRWSTISLADRWGRELAAIEGSADIEGRRPIKERAAPAPGPRT